MNGLALCAGIGASDIGLKAALGGAYRTVGYVERDAFASSIIVARMESKALDPAPIWDCLESFCGSAWRGCVDIVTAGFPCQPASVAGTQLGVDDDRWLWPLITRVIRDVGPRYVLLENVAGLLGVGRGAAFGEVLGDLAECGFDAEWGLYSAQEVGAPHLRERVFVFAWRVSDTSCDTARNQSGGEEREWSSASEPRNVGAALADTYRRRCEGERAALSGDEPLQRRGEPDGCGAAEPLGRPGSERLEGLDEAGPEAGAAGRAGYPPIPSATEEWLAWVELEGFGPSFRKSAHEPTCALVRDRVDMLRVLGNSCVPSQLENAFRELWERSGL
jgi:DNA (cytosine-5)-methyltransferase 1